jgi:hypothetical protein
MAAFLTGAVESTVVSSMSLQTIAMPTTWVKTWVTLFVHRILIGEFDRHRFRQEIKKTVAPGRLFYFLAEASRAPARPAGEIRRAERTSPSPLRIGHLQSAGGELRGAPSARHRNFTSAVLRAKTHSANAESP